MYMNRTSNEIAEELKSMYVFLGEYKASKIIFSTALKLYTEGRNYALENEEYELIEALDENIKEYSQILDGILFSTDEVKDKIDRLKFELKQNLLLDIMNNTIKDE